jgi:hypothetical protein
VAVAPAHHPLVLGVLLLAPPLAVGTVFGSGAAVVLAALGSAWWTLRRGSKLGAGLAVLLAVLASAPGLNALPGGGWVSVVLFLAGTGAAWWLAAISAIAATETTGEHESDEAPRRQGVRE